MAVDEGEIKNLKVKRNQNLDHCKNCTAMQNTKKGQEKCCKWLRGIGKSMNHYKVQCDAQATIGTKRQKQAQGKWQ